MLDCEQEVLGLTHQDLSAEALAIWKLPVEIQNAVRHHHILPEEALKLNPAKIPLNFVLDAANQYVNSTGVLITDQDKEFADGKVIESLGIPPQRLEATLAEFKTEFDAMMQFFR